MPEVDLDDLNKIWSQFGLQPQAFPILYPMSEKPFLDGQGNPSGAIGAIARLSHELSNFPHMFLGVRISNVYGLPEGATDGDVQRYRALKEHTDGEQTVRMTLAQQNVTADGVLQIHLTGRADGLHWHPFPVPFPMAGGNTIALEITRLTSYPTLVETPVLPRAYATIVAAVLRADLKTSRAARFEP